MKLGKVFQILLSCLVLHSLSFAQIQTNFERIDSLISISAVDLSEELERENEYFIDFVSSADYRVLEAKLISHLQKNGLNLKVENEANPKIKFNFDEARIKYGEVYRDGLFGTYLVERKAEISGSYFVSKNGNIGNSKNFNYSLNDSVAYSDISNLENIGYSFTTAEIPDEPFFSSTLEPVIAIGSAAVAVYLFFNIRSK